MRRREKPQRAGCASQAYHSLHRILFLTWLLPKSFIQIGHECYRMRNMGSVLITTRARNERSTRGGRAFGLVARPLASGNQREFAVQLSGRSLSPSLSHCSSGEGRGRGRGEGRKQACPTERQNLHGGKEGSSHVITEPPTDALIWTQSNRLRLPFLLMLSLTLLSTARE